MLAGLRRAVSAPRHALSAAGDRGFTLIEVIVAAVLIGIIMTGVTTFFVATLSVMSQQGSRQAAIRLADDATERIRAMQGSAILAGRGSTSTNNQWASAPGAVAPYLSNTNKAWDESADSADGASAALPTTAESVTLNGLTYLRSWYIGTCWQRTSGGDCHLAQGSNDIELLRAIVAVRWSDRHCAGSTCYFVTSTLVSRAADPVFNVNAPGGFKVKDPGAQVGSVDTPFSLQLKTSGGAAKTWQASGTPSGISLTSGGLMQGTPCGAGTYTVLIHAWNAGGDQADMSFTWTVT